MAETLSRSSVEPTELHYVAVDQSYDAEQAARDAANDRLTQELSEGGRVSRFVKNIWKGGALKEYYQLKYQREAMANIEHAGDVNLFRASQEQSDRARMATIDRFLNENDEMIHREAGEERMQVADDAELSSEIKSLIRQNVEGTLSDQAMLEERSRLLSAYQESRGDGAIGEGRVRVDNMLEIAAAVRGAIDHGESIDAVMAGMKISMGESRSSVRTEARYNKVERIADKLSKSKIGSLIGPEVVATSTTIAASVLRFGSQSVVGALTKTVVPGVAAGLWAGLRENKRMKDDRVQHMRDMAMGKEITDNSPRREAIEKTRYTTASANELVETLGQHFNEETPLDSKDAYEAALAALSAVESRIRLSDSQNIDLISYSHAGAVEEERLALDIARAQAKTVAEAQLDPDMRRLLSIEDDVTLQALIDDRAEAFLSTVETDMTDKDRAFKKLKRRHVAAAAAKGALIGMAVGAAVQEGIAAASDTRSGLVEQLWDAQNQPIDGTMHQTLAESLVHGTDGAEIVEHHAPSGTYADYDIGDRGTLTLSSDQTLVENADGTLTLKDPTGKAIAENLTANPDGSLTNESLARMRDAGLTVENTSHTVDLPPITEREEVGLDEYLQRHEGDTTKVTRDFWYDNDTARFDRNELALWWGGEDNNGLTENGGYQFSVASMTEGGSSNGGNSIEWQEAARNGDLKLAISASGDSQTDVFMVDIKPDGTADIPPGHPAAEFFSKEDGQAVFNGRYAEVVEVSGVDEDGVTHMRPLATEVGSDTARDQPFTVTNEVPQQQTMFEYKVTSNGYDTVTQQDTFTEMAPVVPIIARRPLEKVRYLNEALEERAPGYYGERHMSRVERERFRDEISPRLWENPDADLNPHEELSWYRDTLGRKWGSDYVEDIDRLISSSPELSNLSPKLRNIVKIPVNAAGEAESEGIYDVLTKAYGQQDKEALEESLILLHVNWFDDLAADPEKRAIIEKTKAEIERAKKDFPDLKIATVETEWKRAEVTDGVIGHVSRRLNDAALLAVEAAMSRGEIDSDQDVLLIRNDADPKGMSKSYLKRYAEAAERNGRTDVFTGTTSFDNTKADRLPGFVLAANFMQSLDLLATSRLPGRVHTAGANFAVRASIFAAVGCTGFERDNTGAGSDDVGVGRRIQYARSRAASSEEEAGTAGYFRAFRRKKQGTYYAASGEPAAQTKRKVAVRVTGARIDTDSDREEVLYRRGQPIIHTWDNGAFDKNGYSDRNEGLDTGFEREDAAGDSDTVLERIRNDMEGSINVFADEALVRTALAMTFSTLKEGSVTDAYELKKDRDGKYHFSFTDIGRAEIIKRLTRDSKGRFDPYGSRKLRQMYGETRAGARRQATHQSMVRV